MLNQLLESEAATHASSRRADKALRVLETLGCRLDPSDGCVVRLGGAVGDLPLETGLDRARNLCVIRSQASALSTQDHEVLGGRRHLVKGQAWIPAEA